MAAKRPIVFLAFANDRERRARYLRNLPEEARRLRAVLAEAERVGLCKLVVRQNLTVEELFTVFQGAEYRDRIALFHYGGHANGYALLLEEAGGGVAAAHAAGLAQLLGAQRGLRLVFLNGCATEPQAQGLTDAGVAAVLVTSQAIDDQIALEFAGHFYAGLGGGASIETAYAEAKAAVATRCGSGVLREAAPDLYRPDVQSIAERWPWQLYLKDGASRATQWNLPQAAGDPLFGLPQLPPTDLPEHPYRHLQPFGRAHAELFFGRGREIRTLYERITDPHAAPILLLYGRSGVGKSSLLEAGLIPRLEQTHRVVYRRRDQALGLWGTLRDALDVDGGKGLPPEDSQSAIDAVTGAEDSIAEAARDYWHHQERHTGQPLTLILDQVEEVYTRPDPGNPGELSDFLDALEQLLGDPAHRPRGKLALGLRQEWLPELEQGFSERELPRSTFYLQPLDRAGLIDAVAGPKSTQRLQQRYGLSIEEGLPEAIADALLADPQAPLAPTLQVLLDQLWKAAKHRDPAHPHFDSILYRARKRDGFLLGDYLDRALERIAEQHPEAVRSGLVLDLLAYHTTSRGTAEAYTREAIQQEYVHQRDRLPALIEACQAPYLLLPTEGAGTRLSHDTLAPLIRERFEESDRPGQRARTILEGRAPDWADAKDGTPLDQADLAIVETGIRGMRAPTADEERLLAASRAERVRRQRVARRLRLGAAVAMLLILVATGIATWQWWRAEGALNIATKRERELRAEKDETDRERRLAQSRQLAAQASLAITRPAGDLVLGTLLATESLRRTQTVEGYHAWSAAMSLLPRKVLRLVHEGSVGRFALAPDGKHLAATVNQGHTAMASGAAQLWALDQGEPLATLAHKGEIAAVAFSDDGSLLAAASWDHSVSVLDVVSRKELYRVTADAGVAYVAFDRQARYLAMVVADKTVRLVEARTGKDVVRLPHPDFLKKLAFTPDGRFLLTACHDKIVRVWQAGTDREHARLVHPGPVNSWALTPDGCSTIKQAYYSI